MERRPCRCLLREDESQRPLYELIRETLAAMPDALRASEPTRERRLAACAACERLLGGTCALCGCYVELRAAKRGQRCADTPPRWTAEPPDAD